MKIIDKNTWKRKEIYDFYKNFDIPRYLISFEVDVTELYDYVKQQQLSFYYTFMHVVLTEINRIENFKYRMIGDDVIYYDVVHPSFTDTIKDSDLFKIVASNYHRDLHTFIKEAAHNSLQQGSQFIDYEADLRQDLVYISVFPWASYTQISNVTNIEPHDAIPRVTWGKYRNVNSRLMMPLSIEVHHAFVDGFHVGLLIQNIEQKIKQIQKALAF